MTADSLRDEPQQWRVRSTEDLHRDDWVVALRADQLDDGEGGGFRRLVLEEPGAVMIFPVDEQEQVVLLRQYRHPVGRRLIELPAGMLDVEGEEPRVSAERELREEAGLFAEHWKHLFTTYPSPGITSGTHAYFLATGLREVGRGDFEPHAEEADMSVERVPFADLLEAVRTGRVQDGPLVMATLAYAVFVQAAKGESKD